MQRKLMVPLVAAFALFGSLALAPIALADNPKGFDIEVQRITCINRDKPCNTFATATNSLYTQVTALSDERNVREGTPEAVNFTCGKIRIESDGPHIIAMHVFAGEKSLGYDGGVIKGEAELQGRPTEASTHAAATINLWASDPVTGDSGTARGSQVTNNVTDTRVAGGFSVEIHGPIYDEPTSSSQQPTHVIGHGEMECNTFGPSFKTQFPASGPFFESVIGNTDND